MPHRLPWNSLLLPALLVAAISAAGLYAAPARAGAPGALPAGLPTTFWMGLASQPGDLDWMHNSHVPWNARYQYLSGGANTGSGWATWWPGNGGYARDYMTASRAAGYLPVFTYYQLRFTLPHAGPYESDQDLNNLADPTAMTAYFQDFALLLRQCAAFGGPVIIHVEPDFWGYMEQRVFGGSNSLATLPAAVSRSGYAPVAGYPDTIQGFAEALLHLRDTIAPNALLAVHASTWGRGPDVATSRDPALDMAALGAATGAFLNTGGIQGNPPGTSRWDLLFVDLSDRDADWYRLVAGDNGAHWWDATGATLPNFDRYRAWVAALSAATGLRAVLWQVPIGNNVTAAMNNSPQHYQDNRSVYFLGNGGQQHLADWIAAGVVGILWGRGSGDGTTYTDDGDYLRSQAAAYYQRGALPLPAMAPAGPPSVALDPARDAASPTGFGPSARFRAYWATHGGLAVNGYAISPERQEVSPTDGKPYVVQWFERARFEWHPENSDPFRVLLGQLGRQVTAGRTFATVPVFASTADRRYFPETGHSLSGRFLAYWQATGGLAQHGFPISEPFTATSPSDGKSYLVQYFERARFEWHPENQAPYDVLLGLLGRQLYTP